MAALATLLLFNMVGLWNEWFMGTIFLNDRNWLPLQTYLYNRINISLDFTNITKEQKELAAKFNSRTLRAAQIFVSTLPIMLVYPFLQKYFMTGIVLGSVKE
jgi:ABC-type glycerol-3-phosphate transport system permease component